MSMTPTSTPGRIAWLSQHAASFFLIVRHADGGEPSEISASIRTRNGNTINRSIKFTSVDLPFVVDQVFNSMHEEWLKYETDRTR